MAGRSRIYGSLVQGMEFAAEVRQVDMDILTAVEEGRFDQKKELATYLLRLRLKPAE